MIIWQCDACGKREESPYCEYHEYGMYRFDTDHHREAHPAPPVGWWYASRVIEQPRKPYLRIRKVNVACSGACMDQVQKKEGAKPGGLNWQLSEDR